MDIPFKINVLGNGSASPHIDRPSSAHCLEINHQFWLMDCGENLQFRLLALGLKRSKIKGICITHLHADHYLGIFGLLASMSLDRRKEELIIIAPRLLKDLIDLNFSDANFKWQFDLKYIFTDEVNELQEIYQSEYLKIEAFPLSHRVFCVGFKINVSATFYKLFPEKLAAHNVPKTSFKQVAMGEDVWSADHILVKNELVAEKQMVSKTYAYCSDTRYLKNLHQDVFKADLLYHESTFLTTDENRADETGHSTAAQAALVAKEAEVERLLIGHFSSRYTDVSVFEEEAQAIFGNTQVVKMGDVIEL